VLVTNQYDANDEIYTIRTDGSDPRNLSGNVAAESDPDWGP
jgi:hypothetical protein